MDEPTMKKLYEYNMSFDPNEELAPKSRKRKQEQPECWAGFGLRLMLMLLYVISVLCLLRYDEALKSPGQMSILKKSATRQSLFVSVWTSPFEKPTKMEVGHFKSLAPHLLMFSQV
jgi:hypothetical protein